MAEEFFFTLEPFDKKGWNACLSLKSMHKSSKPAIFYADDIRKIFPGALSDVLLEEKAKSCGMLVQSRSFLTTSCSQIPLSTLRIKIILSQLASRGLLKVGEEKLFFDPFVSARCKFYATSTTSNQIVLEGKLEGSCINISLHNAVVFPYEENAFYIYQGTLRFFTFDLETMVIKNLAKGPMSFTLSEWKIFHDRYFLEEKKEHPDLIITSNLEAISSKILPLPELVLMDRSGAFANLYMDYPGFGKFLFSQIPMQDRNTKMNRHLKEEKAWENDLLETSFMSKMVGTSHYYCPLDKVGKSLAFLIEIGWNVIDYTGKRVVLPKDLHLALDKKDDTIRVSGKLIFDSYEADVSKVIGAFNRHERFLDLSADAVGLMDENLLSPSVREELEAIEMHGGECHISKGKLALLDPERVNSSKNPELLQQMQKLRCQEKLKGVIPGEQFQGTLYTYQQQGLEWLSVLYEENLGGILADEMGLGKTVQILALLSRIELKKPVMIVLPTTLIFNWQRELERFLPDYPYYIHQGKERCKNLDQLRELKGCIFTSYSLLRQDEELFSSVDFSLIIIDEAQAIKNPNSLLAKTIFSLKSDFRIAITGTPIENQWEDLWSLFNFTMPNLLGSISQFQKEAALASNDSRYLKRMQKLTHPFILRRRKGDVGIDLPPLQEQVVWLELDEEQKQLYEHYIKVFKAGLLKKVALDGVHSHRMEIFEALLRLRQICVHPLLIQHEGIESSKLRVILEDIREIVASKHKVLVYSQFTKMLGLIRQALIQEKIPFVYLDGQTKDREEVVRMFQEEEFPVFLVSLKAGGVGLNLQAADYVLIADPWWNDAVEKQAIHRAHRMGRKQEVIAKRYIQTHTIEEKILKIKERKKQLAENYLEESELFISLTDEEILALFD